MKATITCRQAVDFISKREEGKLSARQRMQLWQHFAICSLCRLFAHQNKLLVKALSGYRDEAAVKLDDARKNAIIDAVLSEGKK